MASKKKKHKFRIVKIILSLLIVAVLFTVTMSELYKATMLPRVSCHEMTGFLREDENILDGIYLGTSAADRFWMAPRAFESEGICIYNLGTDVQPFISTKYMINEALKTQPDIDYVIIELRGLVRPAKLHSNNVPFKALTTAMPFSRNRTELIKTYLDFLEENDVTMEYDRYEYYIPFLTDHFAWFKELSIPVIVNLFTNENRVDYKGYWPYYEVEPQNPKGEESFLRDGHFEPWQEEALDDLLEYCKTLDCEVIFVSAPMANMKWGLSKLHEATLRCQEAGFTTLDFNVEPLRSEVNMNWEEDFYDFKHTNVNGARHYTDCLTKYLVEHYDMPDHRGDETYKGWQKEADRLRLDMAKNKSN